MPDILISAVRYNSSRTHIVQVQQHKYMIDKVGMGIIVDRLDVVANIKAGLTYATIYSENGQWKYGNEVIIDEVNRIEYIKTEPDNTTADNLGELPEF